MARNTEIIFVVSDLLDLELINAPQQVRDHLLKYSPDKFQRVELTEEVIKLADTYILEKVVGLNRVGRLSSYCALANKKSRCFRSWNFKNIVNKT